MKRMLITNNPEVACFADSLGVEIIFVDLETIGKSQRQGHLDTLISSHSIKDVALVKDSINYADLLVRINPYHEKTFEEIESVINSGADIIMLPMINDVNDVFLTSDLINGRCRFVPLLETVYSVEYAKEISRIKGVTGVHFGLNDLKIERNDSFIFKSVLDGTIESSIKGLEVPFGIGGVSKLASGDVPGGLVLSKFYCLGSTSVILARSFHNDSKDLNSLVKSGFQQELEYFEDKIRALENNSLNENLKFVSDFNFKVNGILGKA
ncbi:aldolase/citrate lyase family protein [Vibrio splendidus]